MTNYRPCSTCVFYEKLPAKDRTAFDQWITDQKNLTLLWRACKDQGLTIVYRTFRDHFLNGHHNVTV